MVSEMLHQYSCLILNIPCAHSYTLHTSVFHKYSISNSFLGEINDTRLNGIAVVKKGKAKLLLELRVHVLLGDDECA
jgi:hypothetical protein